MSSFWERQVAVLSKTIYTDLLSLQEKRDQRNPSENKNVSARLRTDPCMGLNGAEPTLLHLKVYLVWRFLALNMASFENSRSNIALMCRSGWKFGTQIYTCLIYKLFFNKKNQRQLSSTPRSGCFTSSKVSALRRYRAPHTHGCGSPRAGGRSRQNLSMHAIVHVVLQVPVLLLGLLPLPRLRSSRRSL